MTEVAIETEQTESGLLIPTNMIPAAFHLTRPIVRTVTLPSGERARVTVEEGHRVRHTLRSLPGSDDERQDVLVCPEPVRFALRRQ